MNAMERHVPVPTGNEWIVKDGEPALKTAGGEPRLQGVEDITGYIKSRMATPEGWYQYLGELRTADMHEPKKDAVMAGAEHATQASRVARADADYAEKTGIPASVAKAGAANNNKLDDNWLRAWTSVSENSLFGSTPMGQMSDEAKNDVMLRARTLFPGAPPELAIMNVMRSYYAQQRGAE